MLSRELFWLHAHLETCWALTRTLLSCFFGADFYLEGDPELDASVMLLLPRGAPFVKEVLLWLPRLET